MSIASSEVSAWYPGEKRLLSYGKEEEVVVFGGLIFSVILTQISPFHVPETYSFPYQGLDFGIHLQRCAFCAFEALPPLESNFSLIVSTVYLTATGNKEFLICSCEDVLTFTVYVVLILA